MVVKVGSARISGEAGIVMVARGEPRAHNTNGNHSQDVDFPVEINSLWQGGQ